VARTKISLATFRLTGAIGGLTLLCLTGFLFIFFRKRGGLKIPKIRRASGPMSLFDPQEERPGPGMEEAAVERPLSYVCGTGSLSLLRFLARMSMLRSQDPTNPATFSRVHAELERPLYPGGTQGSVGYYDHDPYHRTRHSAPYQRMNLCTTATQLFVSRHETLTYNFLSFLLDFFSSL